MAKDRILIGIPTKNRPRHLSLLLSNLISMKQDEFNFDLLIVDSSDRDMRGDSLVSKMIRVLELSHRVFYSKHSSEGKSEVKAINEILYFAYKYRYDLLYKIDDDHVLLYDAVETLYKNCNETNENIIVSGITPWMRETFPGSATPEEVDSTELRSPLSQVYVDSDDEVRVTINHFTRKKVIKVVGTQIASPANFMMRPDIRILWTELSDSSLYVDIIWFLQLKMHLGYELYFNTGVNIWHVAAEVGGVRVQEGNYKKDSNDDIKNEKILASYLRRLNLVEEEI